MRYQFLLTIFLFNFIAVWGQEPAIPSGQPEKKDFTKYSSKERKKFYPFSEAAAIMIVSFDKQAKKIDSSDWRFGKPVYKGHKDISYGLPFLNDTLCFSRLAQKKILSPANIDTLTDIMYNSCYRWTITEYLKASCYTPHNAILFLDNEGKLSAYIEICFGCNRVRYSSDTIKKFEDCDVAMADLKRFFQHFELYVSEKEFDNNSKAAGL